MAKRELSLLLSDVYSSFRLQFFLFPLFSLSQFSLSCVSLVFLSLFLSLSLYHLSCPFS